MRPVAFQDLVLFEDQDYVLVNKPPFVATLEDRNDPQNMLAMARVYTPDRRFATVLTKIRRECWRLPKIPKPTVTSTCNSKTAK